MKIATFVIELWSQLEISDKTKSNYVGAYRRYLEPTLGDLEISEIGKKQLIDLLAVLPSQTRYQTFMVAKVIFREAIIRELIEDSPMTGLATPKILVKPQKFLTWEELREIDFGFHTKRIQFLALHGLRYGEAVALLPEDIHDGRVYITKSKYGATKTKSSIRSVPQMADYVHFPLYQDKIAKSLRPHGVTVHSLRKTYAYLLKQANIHVTTAAKLMGHANPLITMKIYTQVLDDEIDKTGLSLSGYLNLNN